MGSAHAAHPIVNSNFIILLIRDVFVRSCPENGPGRAREVFKKPPGGRGFVLTEYEHEASHKDPVREILKRCWTYYVRPNHRLGAKWNIFFTKNRILGGEWIMFLIMTQILCAR